MPLKYIFRISDPEIQNAFKKGKRLTTPFFSVFFIPNKLSFSRFAVIVPNNSAKTIVKRNKIKRILWTGISEEKNKKPGLDIVIKTKGLITLKPKEIKTEVSNLLSKIIFKQ